MGNGITKNPCFSGDPYAAVVASDPPRDDSLGHSFTYVPSAAAFDLHHPPPASAAAMMVTSSESSSSFFSLSGAAISANMATSASMPSFRSLNELTWLPASACTFESSRSFSAVPLQAAPPSRLSMSGPLQSVSCRFSETSGFSDTSGTLSDGPFLSGAQDSSLSASSGRLQPSSVPPLELVAARRKEQSLLRFFARTASRLRGFRSPRYVRRQTKDEPAKVSVSDGDYPSPPNGNVEWAQGVAGEDRFHVAVSEESGWVFVGIYDGFSGPDATDYLFANLYVAVHDELKGVLWDQDAPGPDNADENLCLEQAEAAESRRTEPRSNATTHRDVLRALARALKRTEDAFFEAAEQRAEESPELGMVGSCVLVMLMKGVDAYVMNVGDSRAVLARRPEPDLDILGKAAQDLRQFNAEVKRELRAHDMYVLQAVQLTPEHSAAVEEVSHRAFRLFSLVLLCFLCI
jgi:serine/threonine protein phosphatase PrpC